MKNHHLHERIAAMLASAGFAFAGVAMAANTPMSAEAYKAE